MTLFHHIGALDWGIPEGMSRRLSEELEALIDLMVSADDQDQQDEGISIGEEEMVSSLCRKITQSCRRHHSPVSPLLSSNCLIIPSLQAKCDGAEDHYLQVCQDLVEQRHLRPYEEAQPQGLEGSGHFRAGLERVESYLQRRKFWFLRSLSLK